MRACGGSPTESLVIRPDMCYHPVKVIPNSDMLRGLGENFRKIAFGNYKIALPYKGMLNIVCTRTKGHADQ